MEGSEQALGVGLAFASGLAWTSLDAIRKRLSADLSAPAILLGMVAAQLPLYAALLASSGVPELQPDFAGWVVAAAAVAIAANLLLVRALQISPLSLTVPFLSFTPVATLATGALLLGQLPSARGAVGVLVLVAGAFLLNAGPAELRRHPLEGFLRERGSQLALGVAALFAFGNAIDRRAVVAASEPAYVTALCALMLLLLLLPAGPRRELGARRALWPWLALAGAVTAAALLLQLLAFRYLFVAYADSVKRATANLLAVVFGALLFAEGDPRRRLIAALLMSVGVALVVLG